MKKGNVKTSESKIEKKLDKLSRTVDHLAESTARGFASVNQRFEKIEKEMATKTDLANLKDDMEVMVSSHIGTFRRDYDELAHRVKKPEVTVFRR